MKNLLLILLFVLPIALFSAAPRCLDGMEVSLIDCNGKVVKTGKLNSQGKLTLDGADPDCAWDIKLTNNGKSVALGVKGGIDKSSPILYKSKLSDVKGGDDLVLRKRPGRAHSKVGGGNSGLATGKRGAATESNINTSRSNKKTGKLDTDSDNDGLSDGIAPSSLDDDCDGVVDISVTSKGKGKVEITITSKK